MRLAEYVKAAEPVALAFEVLQADNDPCNIMVCERCVLFSGLRMLMLCVLLLGVVGFVIFTLNPSATGVVCESSGAGGAGCWMLQADNDPCNIKVYERCVR